MRSSLRLCETRGVAWYSLQLSAAYELYYFFVKFTFALRTQDISSRMRKIALSLIDPGQGMGASSNGDGWI